MTVTTLNSSAISAQAIFGLNQATRNISDSTQRLSSGIRFANGGDDVGALATANRLNTQVVSLRQAQTNNLQANSLLQTAYSAASEIGDILDSMRALSVQANSGTLTATERATLDLEFQQLRAEVDSISGSTNFNNINLLDGSVSGQSEVASNTSDATQSAAVINVTAPFANGDFIYINREFVRAGVDFAVGANATEQAANLFGALQASQEPEHQRLEFELAGTAITVRARAGGTLGDFNMIDDGVLSTGSGKFDVLGTLTPTANIYQLNGGRDDGMFLGSTLAAGTIGDSLVNTQSQTQAQRTITIVNNALLDDNDQLLRIDDGTALGYVNFVGRTGGAAALSTEFNIGATASETLKNLVSTVKTYNETNDLFTINQLEFEIIGDSLTIRARQPGFALDPGFNPIAIQMGGVGAEEGSLSGTDFNNGSNTGVNTSSVMNPDFIGTISGFSATYVGADSITASITVGDDTYTANITDTTPAANTVVAFVSTNGGTFNVELSGGNGMSVSDQDDADTYAARLNAAFSTLTFSQQRRVSSFSGSGQLGGGYATFNSDDFSSTVVNSIRVTDSSANLGQARIDIEIGNERFTTNQIGAGIGANETVYLRSVSTADRYLAITNGNGAIDLSTANAATTFAATLRSNFGLDESGTGGLSFQLGNSASDSLTVSIDSASSDSLFDGATPDLLSQVNAVAATTVIDGAQDELAKIIAGIGASQARLDYSYNATSSAITELDFARGLLQDTDIPSESTAYAQAVVQQQAAISVLAQTQLLSNNLLALLDGD